jgi:hypothetical protein
MKQCGKCEIEKDESSYWKNKRYKDGKDTVCIDCFKKKAAENKEIVSLAQKKWREKNPNYMKEYGKSEKSKEYHKEYYKKHAELYTKRAIEWKENNKEKEAAARRNYKDKNSEKVNEYHRKWKQNKRENDIQYKLQSNMSRRIRYELNTLLKGKKTKRTTEYIGCTIDELKNYIENKFTNGMTWENYGKMWHIDHIIPCSAWDVTSDMESYYCWNFRNLQPLLASENKRKKDKYDEEDKDKYVLFMENLNPDEA